jgi:hypothetical protein
MSKKIENFKSFEIRNPKFVFGGTVDHDPEIRKKNKKPGQNNADDSQDN